MHQFTTNYLQYTTATNNNKYVIYAVQYRYNTTDCTKRWIKSSESYFTMKQKKEQNNNQDKLENTVKTQR